MSHQTEERNYWRRQICVSKWLNVITFFTALGSFVALFVIYKTLCATQVAADATRIQAEAATNNLRLEYPAKLKLFDVIILDNKSQEITKLTPGMHYNGQAQFINIGRQKASELSIVCYSGWLPTELPMIRPYLKQPTPCSQVVSPGCALPTADRGCALNFTFDGTLPNNLTQDGALYFMGWITYKDPVSGGLFILFARKFDPTKGRFVTVANANYENEQ
ncbi:MAG TPA: hypothetical protein VHY35_13510 [Stellaceae bacterium]|jgi:hypothetical protein|nr:hypothetical protein [Stellaceae bacterium]